MEAVVAGELPLPGPIPAKVVTVEWFDSVLKLQGSDGVYRIWSRDSTCRLPFSMGYWEELERGLLDLVEAA